AVIRVEDIFRGTNQDPPIGEYIFARDKLTANVDRVGTLWQIRGLQVMADGRVVILAWLDGNRRRLYYSSHIDQTIWNDSPGGFLDVVSLIGSGRALGKWGHSFTVHTPEGIAFARPTNSAIQPLAIEPAVTAHRGARFGKTLRRIPDGELFLGSDHQVYLFDGYRTIPVGEDVKEDLQRIYQLGGWLSWDHPYARLDTYREEYWLLIPVGWGATKDADWGIDGRKETYAFIYHWPSKSWRKALFPGLLTAMSDGRRTPMGVLAEFRTGWKANGTRTNGIAHAGYPTYDEKVSGAQTPTSPLWIVAEPDPSQPETITDEFPPHTGYGMVAPFAVAESSDDDAGQPGYLKEVDRARLYLVGENTGLDTWVVEISGDRGNNWYRREVEINFVAGVPVLVDFVFGDEGVAAEAWRFRVSVDATKTVHGKWLHFAWLPQATYPVEAL
ncbi:MAG: hypothetical protein KDD47_26755, partial [Acidobacteria bacterium]|nr:hypothetical protein [Acidobacteriota bacterium]